MSMAPFKDLEELLFPGQYSLDGSPMHTYDVLASAAYNTIKILRDSLSLALKAKNDALAERNAKEMQRAANERTLLQYQRERDEAREDVQRKLGVINLLNAKLAELRPPEPKFRVGQVVMNTFYRPPLAIRIVSVEWGAGSMPPQHLYYYSKIGGQGCAAENYLRALTDEER